jgi:hypothetical protein
VAVIAVMIVAMPMAVIIGIYISAPVAGKVIVVVTVFAQVIIPICNGIPYVYPIFARVAFDCVLVTALLA